MALAGRATDLPDIGATLQAKIVELAETGDIAALAKLRARIPEGARRDRAAGRHRPEAGRRPLERARGERPGRAWRPRVADGRLGGCRGSARPPRRGSPSSSPGAPSAGRDAERVAARAAPCPWPRRWPRRCGPPSPARRVEVAGSLRRGRESVHDIDLVADRRRPGGPAGRPGGAPRSCESGRGPRRGARGGEHPRRGARGAGGGPARLVRQPAPARDRLGRAQRPAARAGRAPGPVGVRARHRRPGRHGDRAPTRTGSTPPSASHPIPPELREDAGRDRGRPAGPLPVLVTRERPAGRAARRTPPGATAPRASRRWWRRPARAGYALPGDQRPLAEPGDGRRARPRAGAPPVGGDRRGGRAPRRHHGAEGHRGGHPGRRPRGLRGRAARRASTGSRRACTRPSPRTPSASPRACWRPSRARSSTSSGTPPAGCWGAARRRRSTSTGWRPPRRRPAPSWRSTASRGASTSTPPWPRRALAAGARLTIGSDAHSAEALDLVRFGVLVARRAGARPEDVGNTWEWPELAAGARRPPAAPRAT